MQGVAWAIFQESGGAVVDCMVGNLLSQGRRRVKQEVDKEILSIGTILRMKLKIENC